MTATQPVDREALRRKTAPLLLCERARTHARSGRVPLQASRPLSRAQLGATTPPWSRARRAPSPALGLARGERVAIMGDACEEWMICDLAAQSLGAIVYGIYPTASASEVEYQMRDGGAVMFVAENQEYVDKILAFADRLPALRWIVVLDDSAMFAYGHPKLGPTTSLLAQAGPAPTSPGSSSRPRSSPRTPPPSSSTPRAPPAIPRARWSATASISPPPRTSSSIIRRWREKEHRTVGYLPLCHVLGRDVAVTLPLISRLVPHFGENSDDLATTLFETRADRAVHRAALSAEIRLAGADRHPQSAPARKRAMGAPIARCALRARRRAQGERWRAA